MCISQLKGSGQLFRFPDVDAMAVWRIRPRLIAKGTVVTGIRARVRSIASITLAATIAASFTLATPVPAQAQGLFDFLGSIFRGSAPRAYNREPPRLLDGFPGEDYDELPPRSSGGPRMAYCVRTCDGRFFPLPADAGRPSMTPAQVCSAMCPVGQDGALLRLGNRPCGHAARPPLHQGGKRVSLSRPSGGKLHLYRNGYGRCRAHRPSVRSHLTPRRHRCDRGRAEGFHRQPPNAAQDQRLRSGRRTEAAGSQRAGTVFGNARRAGIRSGECKKRQRAGCVHRCSGEPRPCRNRRRSCRPDR
jgi:hypothetical protein